MDNNIENNMDHNKDVVIEAVQQDGQAIKYASQRLKNDKEIISCPKIY